MENTQIADQNMEREVSVAAPKADLSLLSQASWLSENVNNTVTEKVEEVKPVVETVDANQELSIEKPAEEIKEESKEDKPVEAVDATLDAPLTLEGEVLNLEENSGEAEGWKSIGKLEGFELETDSYDEFKTKFVEKETAPLRAEIESLRTAAEDKMFEGVDPRVRLNYELAKTGMTLEQIEAPLRTLATYRAMGTAELVRADIEASYPNADATWIDAEVEKQIESGNAAHEETRIRLNLDAMEKQIIDDQQNKIEQYKANSERMSAERIAMKRETISKALNEVPSFMGSTIAPEANQIMAKNYAEGKYDALINDPNFIANALRYKEFGEKAYKAAIAKSEAAGKLSVTKNLSNVPPLDNLGGGKVVNQETLTGLNKLKNDPRFNS